MLPFSKAIKFPFDFGGKVCFRRLSGNIVLPDKVSFGMMKFGFQGSDMFPGLTTVIDLAGDLIIDGNNWIGAGSLLRIEKNAVCVFKRNARIGARSIIFSESRIEFLENMLTSWNCQIMDTDTHSLISIDDNIMYPRSKPVKIGKDCWIGNNVIINKGTEMPEGTIVASMSLCNKNYSKHIKEHSVIGGIPAKVIAEGKIRANDKLTNSND